MAKRLTLQGLSKRLDALDKKISALQEPPIVIAPKPGEVVYTNPKSGLVLGSRYQPEPPRVEFFGKKRQYKVCKVEGGWVCFRKKGGLLGSWVAVGRNAKFDWTSPANIAEFCLCEDRQDAVALAKKHSSIIDCL